MLISHSSSHSSHLYSCQGKHRQLLRTAVPITPVQTVCRLIWPTPTSAEPRPPLAERRPPLLKTSLMSSASLPVSLRRYVLSPNQPVTSADDAPQHYDLAFKTDLQSSPPSFSGEAMITLDVNTDTSKLVFHLHETLNVTHLAISSSNLKTTSSLALSLTSLSINKDLERGVIDLASLPGGGLKSGSKGAKVWFRFESELGGSMMGYYKSEGDLDEQGKKPVYVNLLRELRSG